MKQRKGIALVVSLMILLILTLLGVAIMMFAVNEEQIVGNQMRHIRSLAYAEAGVSEVVRMLNLEKIADPMVGGNYAPDWKTYVLLNTTLPGTQGNTYFVSSAQMTLPGSLLLEYSTEYLDTLNSLVVHHKVNPAHLSEIFYYNWNTRTREPYNPTTYDGAFFPIEVVEATGRIGNANRKIRVEVAMRSAPVNVAAALACDFDIQIGGNFVCCGHNHRWETPDLTDAGADHHECFKVPNWHVVRKDGLPHADEANEFEKIMVDPRCSEIQCLPGVSSPLHNIGQQGNPDVRGNPDKTNDPTIGEFFEIWEMLGAEDEADLLEKYDWQDIVPGTIDDVILKGFYRCAGDLHISGASRLEGVIWVTGDLTQTGNFIGKGLLYSQMDLHLNGTSWILGAIATSGDAEVLISPVNGNATVLYSSEAIQRAISAAYGYTTIAWSEE